MPERSGLYSYDLLDDGEGALLHLDVHAAEILADDAEQHGVDADAGEDERGERGEACGPVGVRDQLDRGVEDHAEEGDRGDEEAEVGGDAERKDGVVEDAVEGEGDEFGEGKLALAVEAGVAGVGYADLLESERGDGSAEVGLCVLVEGELLDDAAGDEAEVAGVGRDAIFAELVDEAVEEGASGADRPAFFAGDADAVDDVGALLPVVEKDRDELGRVLEVAVELDGGVAAGTEVSGEDGALESEVAGEAEGADAGVAGGELGEDLEGCVFGVVVGEDELEGEAVAELVGDGDDGGVEVADRELLVVDGNDDGDEGATVVCHWVVFHLRSSGAVPAS